MCCFKKVKCKINDKVTHSIRRHLFTIYGRGLQHHCWGNAAYVFKFFCQGKGSVLLFYW